MPSYQGIPGITLEHFYEEMNEQWKKVIRMQHPENNDDYLLQQFEKEIENKEERKVNLLRNHSHLFLFNGESFRYKESFIQP